MIFSPQVFASDLDDDPEDEDDDDEFDDDDMEDEGDVNRIHV